MKGRLRLMLVSASVVQRSIASDAVERVVSDDGVGLP
jgi:hypothetical protein